ncbi:MAG: hypothetical protein K8R88_11045 [Armatimonadetes bacterium]|nr:hypothetical protein [Armatimonadota bacterium]
MNFKKLLPFAYLALSGTAFGQGTWSQFNSPVGFRPCSMLQLTDGSILIGEDYDGPRWFKLKPDANGNYATGTWTATANSPLNRLYFGESTLGDGRVIMSGGEYSGPNFTANWTNQTHVYDPVANTWTAITPPAGWGGIGDPPHSVLPDGRYMQGNAFNALTTFFNPTTNTFTPGPTKLDSGSEEGFVLMPEGTLVCPQGVASPNAEKYVPSTNTWVSAGTLPWSIYEASSREPGAGVAIPDGRMFHTGGTGNTVIYSQGLLPTMPGSWVRGPKFPIIATKQVGCKDSMSSLLPNGKVLIIAGPVTGVAGDFLGPTYFFEYDPVTDLLTRVSDAADSAAIPYEGRLIILPNGQIAYSNGTAKIQLYTPTTGPSAAWRPAITWAPPTASPGQTINVFGTQINGLSEGSSYGDEGVPATNFPLVKFVNTSTNAVTFGRTHHHSTMGIATGSVVHYTQCEIPATLATGNYNMFVVANGISSAVGRAINIDAGRRLITGHVNLGDWPQTTQNLSVHVTVVTDLATTPTDIPLDKNGDYRLPYDPGTTAQVTVKVRGSHWLQRSQTVTAGTTGASVTHSLINGDATPDNVVDLSDYTNIIVAFNAVPASANWNPNADLNGDSVIDLTDYTIVVTNFNAVGDN